MSSAHRPTTGTDTVSNTPAPHDHDTAMAYYLSGYLQGIKRGRELENATIARLHAAAYTSITKLAGVPYNQHQKDIHDRHIASCEAQKQDRVPWPDEGPPLPKGPKGYAVDRSPWPPMRYLPFQPGTP